MIWITNNKSVAEMLEEGEEARSLHHNIMFLIKKHFEIKPHLINPERSVPIVLTTLQCTLLDFLKDYGVNEFRKHLLDYFYERCCDEISEEESKQE